MNYKHRRDEEDEFYVDIDNWFKSPYSSLKARYYIEVSSIIVFLLQSSKITPNQLSIFYGFLGLFSGFLLCLKNDVMIYLGLILFVLKGVVDWSDGLLARVTNKTSGIGHVIDTWGSHIGYYSLIFGIGFIATFFLIIFINIGMVTGIVPVVGVPLPLCSYGGSAILSNFIGFGIILSGYNYRDFKLHNI